MGELRSLVHSWVYIHTYGYACSAHESLDALLSSSVIQSMSAPSIERCRTLALGILGTISPANQPCRTPAWVCFRICHWWSEVSDSCLMFPSKVTCLSKTWQLELTYSRRLPPLIDRFAKVKQRQFGYPNFSFFENKQSIKHFILKVVFSVIWYCFRLLPERIYRSPCYSLSFLWLAVGYNKNSDSHRCLTHWCHTSCHYCPPADSARIRQYHGQV